MAKKNNEKFDPNTLYDFPKGDHIIARGIRLHVGANGERYWLASVYGKPYYIGGAETAYRIVRKRKDIIRNATCTGEDPYEEAAWNRRASSTRYNTLADFFPTAFRRIERLRQWKSYTTSRDWQACFRLYILPAIGDVALCEITPDMVAQMLDPIWREPKGARCRQYLEDVLDCAIRDGAIKDNPAKWGGLLEHYLPTRRAMARGVQAKHHAAVRAEELREIARALKADGSLPCMCILFGMLTVGRCSEYLGAHFDEIEGDVFRVPPDRRKDKLPEAFRVPLSKQAKELVAGIERNSNFLFSFREWRKPMSRTNLVRALRRISGREDVTLHGTRSTFSDWCMRNGENPVVSEKCLMHSTGSDTFRAYQRDDLLEQRRELLQKWADFLLG